MTTLVDDIVLLIDCLMHYIVSGWHDLVTVPIGEKLILSWTLQAMKFFTVSLVLELETIYLFHTFYIKNLFALSSGWTIIRWITLLTLYFPAVDIISAIHLLNSLGQRIELIFSLFTRQRRLSPYLHLWRPCLHRRVPSQPWS